MINFKYISKKIILISFYLVIQLIIISFIIENIAPDLRTSDMFVIFHEYYFPIMVIIHLGMILLLNYFYAKKEFENKDVYKNLHQNNKVLKKTLTTLSLSIIVFIIPLLCSFAFIIWLISQIRW
jgi:ABC-type spermidine/putrescine transport system permease subunit I